VVNLLLLLCLFSREVTGCSWGSSKPDPVDCKWSSSSPWSSCSATCGRGTRSKRIKYDPPKHGGAPCDFPGSAAAGQKLLVDGSGKASLREPCNVKKCPGSGSGPGATTVMEWTQWSAWSSCSQTCGGGERTRKRKCNSIGGSLPGIGPRRGGSLPFQLRIVNRPTCRNGTEGTEQSSCGNYQCPYQISGGRIYGCEILENWEVVGEDVKTSHVRTTVECARKCSETDLCNSFWVIWPKVNICHMQKNGEFRPNSRKSAGRCTKGGQGASSCITRTGSELPDGIDGDCWVLCGPQCAEKEGKCQGDWSPCKKNCTGLSSDVPASWCVNNCSHNPPQCPPTQCHYCNHCKCV